MGNDVWNNEALMLLLNVPNIDVNCGPPVDCMLYGLQYDYLWSPLHFAVSKHKSEALKLLLKTPNINVNSVTDYGQTALHLASRYGYNNIDAMKLLLSHPSLTALTLNQKDKEYGDTPVNMAVRYHSLELLALLAADPRVDLDTIDKDIFMRQDNAGYPGTRKVVTEAKKRRLIRAQKRQVSKVLLDGLYDPDSPLSKLLGVRKELLGEIIWKKLAENWQIFPEHLSPSVDLPVTVL